MKLYKKNNTVIGMIHVGALPGTPLSKLSLGEIEKQVLKEAKIYASSGVDAIMLENMHDIPYLKGHVGPEIVASMAIIASGVRQLVNIPVGIQILAAANKEALAVATTAGLNFIRVEGFAFAHVADEGIIESCAAELLRYRKQLHAERIEVWADIKKKHSSHAITADVSISETAHAAEFMHADAVIVTGSVTGVEPKGEEVTQVKSAVTIPLYLGSGITHKNIGSFKGKADGYIVGSEFKKDGDWRNTVDPKRIERFLKALTKA
jgi:uncharacterized protein